MVGAPGERHDRQVGALAGRQGTDLVVESQGAGRVEGREARARRAARAGRRGAVRRGPGGVDRRRASPRRRRTTASTPASRCRGPTRTPAPREARRAARCRSRAARSSAGSARPGRRGRRAARSRRRRRRRSARTGGPGPSTGSSVATARRPVGGTSIGADLLERPGAVLEPLVLVGALGEVRADGDAERQAPAVDVDRAGVRRVRRDADPRRARVSSTRDRVSRELALGVRRVGRRRPRGRRSRAARAPPPRCAAAPEKL